MVGIGVTFVDSNGDLLVGIGVNFVDSNGVKIVPRGVVKWGVGRGNSRVWWCGRCRARVLFYFELINVGSLTDNSL